MTKGPEFLAKMGETSTKLIVTRSRELSVIFQQLHPLGTGAIDIELFFVEETKK
jgi:hypothetical protein